MDKKPLIDNEYFLQKGGWTFALFTEITKEKRFPFGLLKVSGSIDDYKLENCTLMPYGNGLLFLPVRAEIRKFIKKEAGDKVRIILYAEEKAEVIPADILECLKDAPIAYQRFKNLTEEEQKSYIDGIIEIKNQDRKVEKIVKLIEKFNF
jgi:hypothetical protein